MKKRAIILAITYFIFILLTVAGSLAVAGDPVKFINASGNTTVTVGGNGGHINASGNISARSYWINGYGQVINSTGYWVGQPIGGGGSGNVNGSGITSFLPYWTSSSVLSSSALQYKSDGVYIAYVPDAAEYSVSFDTSGAHMYSSAAQSIISVFGLNLTGSQTEVRAAQGDVHLYNTQGMSTHELKFTGGYLQMGDVTFPVCLNFSDGTTQCTAASGTGSGSSWNISNTAGDTYIQVLADDTTHVVNANKNVINISANGAVDFNENSIDHIDQVHANDFYTHYLYMTGNTIYSVISPLILNGADNIQFQHNGAPIGNASTSGWNFLYPGVFASSAKVLGTLYIYNSQEYLSTRLPIGATPSVKENVLFFTQAISPTSIINFSEGHQAQYIIIRCTETSTTFVQGTSIKLRSGVSAVCAVGATYQFINDGGVWYEMSGDTNTQYTAGNGIGLSGTQFFVSAGTGLTQDADGLSSNASWVNATTNAVYLNSIVTNLTGTDCPADQYAYGVGNDGVLVCRADQTGAGGTFDLNITNGTVNSTVSDSLVLGILGSSSVAVNLSSTNFTLSVIGYNKSFWDTALNYTLASAVYVNRTDWTTHDSYPAACGAGLAVSTIGDTNTCINPVASSDASWTLHNSYPAACSAGDAVNAIGDTNTCFTPSGTTNAHLHSAYNITSGNFTGDYNSTGTWNFTKRTIINITQVGQWCTYQNSTGSLITEKCT